jgi:CBS domain containing-hemolysin-like protein
MYGHTPLYTLERLLNLDLEVESNTIGGLILAKLERMPERQELINFPDFDVQVIKIKGPRIELVKVIPKRKKSLQ